MLIELSRKSNSSAAQLGRPHYHEALFQLVGLEGSDVAKAERPLRFPRSLAISCDSVTLRAGGVSVCSSTRVLANTRGLKERARSQRFERIESRVVDRGFQLQNVAMPLSFQLRRGRGWHHACGIMQQGYRVVRPKDRARRSVGKKMKKGMVKKWVDAVLYTTRKRRQARARTFPDQATAKLGGANRSTEIIKKKQNYIFKKIIRKIQIKKNK